MARCKYMPAPANTVIIFSNKYGKHYQAGFTIGNQDFHVSDAELNKEEAVFYCDMLENAFKELIRNSVEDKFKSELGKQAVRDMNTPKIKVINKK